MLLVTFPNSDAYCMQGGQTPSGWNNNADHYITFHKTFRDTNYHFKSQGQVKTDGQYTAQCYTYKTKQTGGITIFVSSQFNHCTWSAQGYINF